jgi:hypothetical protein
VVRIRVAWGLVLALPSAVATCSPLSGLANGAPDAADGSDDAPLLDGTTQDGAATDASGDDGVPGLDGAGGDAVPEPAFDANADPSSDASTSLLGCSAPGLLAYWPLDETGGTSIFDCSANHFDGVLVGTVGHVSGHSGLALSVSPAVDGGNGFNLGSPAKLNINGAMTVSAWINATSDGDILTKDTQAQVGWTLNTTSAPNVRFAIPVNASATLSVQSTLNLGTWVHVAGVFEPSTSLRLYVNGVLRDEVTAAVPATMYTAISNNASLGMRGGTTKCCSPTALIDDVRIFGRVLDATEIAALAQ